MNKEFSCLYNFCFCFNWLLIDMEENDWGYDNIMFMILQGSYLFAWKEGFHSYALESGVYMQIKFLLKNFWWDINHVKIHEWHKVPFHLNIAYPQFHELNTF